MARLLLDECFDRRLKPHMVGHEVRTVAEMRWAGVKNGALLRRAASTFDVLVTIDKSMSHQQRLEGLDLAVVVLDAPSARLADLVRLVPLALSAIATIRPGEVAIVTARR